jgi:oligopeptide transport system substrate-binding protein
LRIRRTAAATGGIFLAAALALSGCSASTDDEPSSSGSANAEAVITTNGSEPQNPLIPTNTTETGGGKIVDSIFAGLVYYDAKGAAHNDVAESIESDDAQNYTIKIREGLTFSDDQPVTASSFVDAWNYGAALDNAQQASYFFEDIEGFSYDENVAELPGLKVVDDTTFTVALSEPRSDFPLRLGYSAFFPLPESAFEDMDAFGQAPIGNGPYMLGGDDAWQHDVKIDLSVNPKYDGPRAPANGGLSIVFYADQGAAYADLLSDNLDVLDAIPDTAMATFTDDLGDRAVNQPAAIFQSFTIPSDLKNFPNAENFEHFQGEEGELRRAAISHAINREEITDVIFEGSRTPASDFTSPVIDGWSDSIPGSDVLDYDEDLAKDLWAQADEMSPWSGELQIAYNADGGHQGWVDAVTNSISNVLGIDASGNPYPTFAESRTLISPNEDGEREIASAFRSGWQADYPGLYNFLGPLYATNASSNDGDYSNPEFDKLIAEGATSTDTDEANKLYQQAQEILFKDLPAIPLWYSNVTGGYSTLVDNVEFGWNSVPLYNEITKE